MSSGQREHFIFRIEQTAENVAQAHEPPEMVDFYALYADRPSRQATEPLISGLVAMEIVHLYMVAVIVMGVDEGDV